MRTTSGTFVTKIFPSPILPVFAPRSIAPRIASTWPSVTTISIFTFGENSATQAELEQACSRSRARPEPLTFESVMPVMPTASRAHFTSSSSERRMMASTRCMSSLARGAGSGHPRDGAHGHCGFGRFGGATGLVEVVSGLAVIEMIEPVLLALGIRAEADDLLDDRGDDDGSEDRHHEGEADRLDLLEPQRLA